MPGYPREILVDDKKFHDRLLCVICKLILRDAVQSTCGHRYCDTCAKAKFASSSKTDTEPRVHCPACSSDSDDGIMNEKEIYPDFHARKELKTLDVKCFNDGCSWKGKFAKYVDHQETQHEYEMEVHEGTAKRRGSIEGIPSKQLKATHEWRDETEVIKCLKAGCGKSLRRGDLAHHLDKDCPMRPVKCRNCGKELPYKNMKKHNSECPKVNVTCSDCGQEMTRDSLQAHQDKENGTCPNKPQRCPYAQYGCTFTISGTGMNEHLQSEMVYHTQLQQDKFEDMMEQGKMWLESQTTRLMAQSVISAGNAEGIGNDEGACASPKASQDELSNQQMEHLIPIFKQVFITRPEQDGNEPNNLKNKSSASPKSGRSQNQSEAVDKRVRDLERKTKDCDREIENMKNLYAVLDKRNETFQEVIPVLVNQLEALAEKANTLERQNRHLQDIIEQQDKQIRAHDQMLTVKNVALAEQELRIQSLEESSFNGILVWKVTEFARRRRDAVSGKTTSFYSPAFYTSYHGYKMCARIYLNGDGMGKGTHVSLFFVVMKGHYDNILRWPFRQKVTCMMVDQGNREHVVDSFRPDPTSSSFKKPTHEMNIASGCPLFVNLNLLESDNHSYVKDDCLFVKVIVDVSDLEEI